LRRGLGIIPVDKIEITPDRSMEIKRVDEEPYHIMDLLTFDVIV
jgi:hypothetical protein